MEDRAIRRAIVFLATLMFRIVATGDYISRQAAIDALRRKA